MYPRLILGLENPIFQSGLVHKSGYSMYLSQIPQPRCIVKCIDGQYFDEHMKPITRNDAISILKSERESIIKIPYGSCQGKSIKKINADDDIEGVFDSYGNDFVCQEIIKQSPTLAKFHPQSINTLRIVTMFINGTLTVCEIILRIGQGDSIVDNAGSGGIMIGCSEEGLLHEYGYDHFGNRHYDNGQGIIFKGQTIPQVKAALNAATSFHPYYFPTMGVVGWDWCIGENDEPIFIEANLGSLQGYPDITTSQLAWGKPFFGERTDEVIDFVNAHQDRIWNGLKI